MDIEDVLHWLREGDEWEAADVLSQCCFTWDWLDTGYPLHNGPEIEIVQLNIRAPRRILDKCSSDLKDVIARIENAIRECSPPHHVHVSEICWIPRLQSDAESPSDSEIETVLSTLDSEHVREAWSKASGRRKNDPDGAITAAKTLIEPVCKHILSVANVRYPPNSDLTKLYRLVSKELELSPDQRVDKNMKRVLGNCQAVVGGIAFLRNNLGDAHSREPGAAKPTEADAELAVNVAGAMATFLVRSWHESRTGGPAS